MNNFQKWKSKWSPIGSTSKELRAERWVELTDVVTNLGRKGCVFMPKHHTQHTTQHSTTDWRNARRHSNTFHRETAQPSQGTHSPRQRNQSTSHYTPYLADHCSRYSTDFSFIRALQQLAEAAVSLHRQINLLSTERCWHGAMFRCYCTTFKSTVCWWGPPRLS